MAESLLFKILEKYRIKPNREFFKCDLSIIQAAFKQIEDMFKDIGELISINNILNEIKFELIALIKNNSKQTNVIPYIDILENDIVNNYDSKITYLKTSEDELSEDKQLYDIINDKNIFNGCVKSLLLYYNDDYINKNDFMEYIRESVFIEKDCRIFKRTELLRWIEKKLNIKRFEVNKIQLNDEEISNFVDELNKLTDLLPSIIDPRTTTLDQVTKSANYKLSILTKLDRIQKFIANLYNMYDDIISYDTKIKKIYVNKIQKKLTIYTNFQIKESTINYHKKFIDKIGSDKFASVDTYIFNDK